MTATEKSIWRGAYDLFEWNREMPDTDQSWTAFITSVTDFANSFSWQDCPLARALAMAVIEAVEGEVKARRAVKEETLRHEGVQLSLFPETSPSAAPAPGTFFPEMAPSIAPASIDMNPVAPSTVLPAPAAHFPGGVP